MVQDNALAGEARYLEARVWNTLGRVKERNEAAAAFQTCMLALNVAQTSEVAVLPI